MVTHRFAGAAPARAGGRLSGSAPGVGARRGRLVSALFAGDPRVWRWAALAGLPLAVLIVVWCLFPRPYFVGTDSVNALSPSPPVTAGSAACAAGLRLPAGTRRLRLQIASGQLVRPGLRLTVSTPRGSVSTSAPAARTSVGAGTPVDFSLPAIAPATGAVPASFCLRVAVGTVALAGTVSESLQPPLTVGGAGTGLRPAVWYLPARGARQSYLDELGTMLRRASLFEPGFLSPPVLGVILLGLLPSLGLLAVRCLALAAAGRTRRLMLWLYVLAALNAGAWSVLTPPFQGPDEVDHFAYLQSLVERGQKPTPYPGSAAARWSASEHDALMTDGMLTDHQRSDTRAPALAADVNQYRRLVTSTRPAQNDGGGLQTTAGYGPLYYYALSPGYLLSGASVASQLALARLISCLIGALASVFAFLLVRELAPRTAWLAVLAALLVAFQPMYSFLSGTINNDVGIDAGAAAVAYLLVRLLRRGFEPAPLCALGLLLGALPFVKGSAFELYPLAALAGLGAGVRTLRTGGDRLRSAASLAGLAVVGAAVYALCSALNRGLTPAPPAAGGTPSPVATVSGSLSGALQHPLSYLEYLWEVFLPRLPGMAPHFGLSGSPAQMIFVRRGWAAFGWYDVFFPGWVYKFLAVATLAGLGLGAVALWRERPFVRRHAWEVALLVLFPVGVVAAFEAVFYTPTDRPVTAEMGRYVFPALAPLAALAAGALYALGRRRVIASAAVLLVVLLAFSYASQLLTLTAFYA